MEQLAILLKNQLASRRNQTCLFFLMSFLTVLMIKKVGFEWKWCHLFFSYEFGFLKRGLIGQLFRILSIPTTWDNFVMLSAIMLTGVIITFHNLIKRMNNLAFIAFAIAFIGTPVLLRNLVHDFGRFDQIAIMFIFLQLLLIHNISALRVLLCFSPLLLFMHEATILWAFPTILAFTFLTDRKSVYVLAPVLVICMLIILKWGDLNVDPEQYKALMEAWAKPIPIYSSVVVTLTDSTEQVIQSSIPALIENIHSPHGIVTACILLAFLLPLFFIKDKLLVLFSVLSLLSACVLFVVAVDHFRWVSLMCFIILFYLLYAHQKNLIRHEKVLYSYLVILGLAGLLFNPVGIYTDYLSN